ncbi:MAG: hypothetical protein HLUCCA12_15845 [Rhodobacteraceae bacterium HLUCCA12]|nr:MAG: hypothetical protein HLUCCA12_15845 [Rhodobacteraceae bacterium HLUCCA12]
MTSPQPKRPTALIEDLVTSTRILINENVLDVFGHVAFRDPLHSEIFWMAAAGAPAQVTPEDVLPFDLDGNPIGASDAPVFVERFLHAAVFKACGELHASCHHHAEALMPYCLGARSLGASSQTGGWMGAKVPLWDSRTRFGDTSMVVTNMAQAEDLILTMGASTIVLLRGHGALVCGASLQDMTFRAVHACREARCNTIAGSIGSVTMLSDGEIALSATITPAAIQRSWDHWKSQLPAITHHPTTKGIQR